MTPIRLARTDITKRQSQILALLADGYAVRQIGARLGIKAATVEDHLYLLSCRLELAVGNPTTLATVLWARGELHVNGGDGE